MSLASLKLASLASAMVPSWQWNFAEKMAIPSAATFSRGSSATCFNNLGILQTAGTNVARFDYDPATQRALGILIEQQSTNLSLYSNDFTNGVWNKARANVTAGAATGPDGAPSASKWYEDTTASNTHQLYQNATYAAGKYYCWSFFARAAERSWCRVRFGGPYFQAGTVDVNFNVGAGTLGSVGTGITAGMRAIGNGWYRCWAYALCNSALTGTAIWMELGTGDNVNAYTGDGVSGLYLFGTQLEDTGNGASSYIATTSATATRSQDLLTMPASAVTGWNGSAGVLTAAWRLHARYTTSASSYDQVPVYIAGTTSGGSEFWMILAKPRAGDGAYGYMVAGSSGQGTRSIGTTPAEFVRSKAAWGFSETQTTLARNNVQTTGTGTFVIPNPTGTLTVYFGSYFNHGLGGNLESVAFYKGARSPRFVQMVSI